MKNLTIALLLVLASFAQAQQEVTEAQAAPKTTQTRTTEGSSWVVSAGYCSPVSNGFGTVSSNFPYSVCQQYITANYEVEGKGWNAKKTLIAGTETSSYRIVTKSNGHSTYVPEDQAGYFEFASVQIACMNIRNATVRSEVAVSATPCGQGQ